MNSTIKLLVSVWFLCIFQWIEAEFGSLPAVREPNGLARSDGKRPDGMLLPPWKMGRPLVWDATCVDTLAPSHLPSTSGCAGAAAASVEGLKRCKYANLAGLSLSVGMKEETDQDLKLSIRAPCPPHTACVPVTSCPLLEDLLDFTCFSSDKYFHRLNQLICNNVNGQDYVCCPACDCGRVYQAGSEHCGQSMVRGVEYNGIGKHPWVARIGFTNKETGNVRFACSGSIIAKRVVLTAAHCALAKPEGYKLSTVEVGEWDIGRKTDCNDYFCAPPVQDIKVENVIVHPGYEQKIFRHDIALIVLKEEIQFSVTAGPICLNDKPEIVINERATLVGWGKLSGQSNPVSRQQQLDVPLVPLENCERIFGESVPVNEGQLCAGGEEGKDACSGFGGAPLLLARDGSYIQLGIVSFGAENCGSEGVPSVYTNIANYYHWIVDNSPS